MCQNCKPQNEIETAVEPTEQIIPFEYHETTKKYTVGGDTLSDDAVREISQRLSHWKTVTALPMPETLPPLESILGFVQVWNIPGNFQYDRALIEDCLVPGVPQMRSQWHSVHTPNFSIVSADTPEKRTANELALAKKWHRFITDCYGAKFTTENGMLASVRTIVSGVGKKHKENGQTFAKRIAKKCLDNGWKLTRQQIETINNIADAGITKPQTFSVRFDNDYLDGSPQQYGNGRSCWWQSGDYGHSRHTFHNDGGYACRTFDHIGAVTGRVWIVPTDYGHLIFNAYGQRIDTFASMLASAWDCAHTEVTIDHAHELYINGDTGYLIGDKTDFPESGHISYRPEYVENDEIVGTPCHYCDRTVQDGDRFSDPNDYTCCERCFCNRFSSCCYCGVVNDFEEIIDCNGDSYCENCAERRGFSRCDDCAEWHRDCACVNNGSTVCPACLDNYTCCEGCSEYFDADECEVSPNDDCSYCCDCMPEPEGEQYCQATGELINTDDIGRDWPTYPAGSLSSRSHCPVIPLFSSELPVSANAIGQMMEIVAAGRDISPYPAAVTAMALCLAGF